MVIIETGFCILESVVSGIAVTIGNCILESIKYFIILFPGISGSKCQTCTRVWSRAWERLGTNAKKAIAKVQKSKEIFSGTLTNSFAWTSKTWKPMLDFLCLSLIVMERKAINTGRGTLSHFKGESFFLTTMHISQVLPCRWKNNSWLDVYGEAHKPFHFHHVIVN